MIKKIALLLTLVLFMASCNSSQAHLNNEFDPNYAHVVYFWLKNPSNQEDRTAFETSLRQFLDNSQFAKTNFIGSPPKATRDVVDDSFTYNLIVSFESAEAQDAYQKEEAHLQFIEESKHLWTKVVVYDASSVK